MKSFFMTVLILSLTAVCASRALATNTIVVCGTGDSQELLGILADRYEQAHPGSTIEISDSIGSGGGIKETAKGNCDLGRVARPIKEKETKYALRYRLFASSPVVFAVNPSLQGVTNISTQQMLQIYAGILTRWADLNGPEEAIYVIDRERGDSSRNVIEKHIPEFRGMKSKAGKRAFSTPEAAYLIRTKRNAIGYLPLPMARAAGLIVLTLDGIYPYESIVAQGKYPLTTPFGIVWKGDLRGLRKSFTEYLFSEEAKQIMRDYGACPANN